MDKEKLIEAYMKGYEEGLKRGWKGAKSMLSRYDGWELKSRMEGKIGTLYQDVRTRRYEIEGEPFFMDWEEQEGPSDRTPSGVPELRWGNMYLFMERKPEISLDIFFQHVSEECKGLCVTHERISAIVDARGEDENVVYCYLGKGGRSSYRSVEYETVSLGNLNKLASVVGEFFKENKGSLMFLSGMNRMMPYVEFEKIQKFTDFVKSKANEHGGCVIVSLPPDILEGYQLQQIKNSFDEVLE